MTLLCSELVFDADACPKKSVIRGLNTNYIAIKRSLLSMYCYIELSDMIKKIK